MSFYTALTGLNAATAQLSVTSNNIANVGTTGFKRSRADFGDIFATSPLQKASSVIGQGVALKSVTQEFSQGNIQFSASSLDIAITGDGFFPLKSADGLQDIFTRNGTFLLDNSFAVVNSAGQALQAASVDSSGKADLDNLRKLIIPTSTTGDARETTLIELSLNVPADGEVKTATFDELDPATYNLTTAVTVFDAGGNEFLATVYYSKTQRASPDAPENKWQTHVYIGDTELDEFLIQATNPKGEDLYVNKYGQVKAESEIPPQDIARGITKLFNLDRLTDKQLSLNAAYEGAPINAALVTKMKAGAFNINTELAAASTKSGSRLESGQTRLVTFTGPATADGTMTVDGVNVPIVSGDTNIEVAEKTRIALLAANKTVEAGAAAGTVLFRSAGDAVVVGTAPAGVIPTSVVLQPDKVAVTLNVDGSPNPVKVDLSDLFTPSTVALNYSGVDLARTLENRINKAYGDLRFFDLSTLKNETDVDKLQLFKIKFNELSGERSVFLTGVNDPTKLTVESLEERVNTALQATKGQLHTITFDGTAATGNIVVDETTVAILSTDTPAMVAKKTVDALRGVGKTAELGSAVGTVNFRRPSDTPTLPLPVITGLGTLTADSVESEPAFAGDVPKFSFSPSDQTFKFEAPAGMNNMTIRSFVDGTRNDIFDLSSTPTAINKDTDSYGGFIIPTGETIRAFEAQDKDSDQRTGIRVRFDDTTGTFSMFSGTTGDESSVEVVFPFKDGSTTERLTAAEFAAEPAVSGSEKRAFEAFQAIFNFEPGKADIELLPTRGIRSTAASVTGGPIGLNLDNKFTLSSETNKFTVTVDNVTGLIELPLSREYTKESFRELLELRINALEDSRGRTVNGAKVTYETRGNATLLKISTGTEGDDSFLKVTGPSIWGLNDLPSGRGNTERWLVPPQAENENGVPLFVDRDGNETTQAGDFSEEETRELFSPVFLDKGELTFNTAGRLISPRESIKFKPTTIGDTGATLEFAINYDGSTQFSSPFSVLAQNQNGRPEGDLIGLDIGDDGLVSANYSNGSQENLAKIILANFSAPTGLRQIGDASYLATSKSGATTLGEAGTAGFGTVRAGARERANVDLTQELIELITAQRNFQANAKAIETNNTLTQAIINIRN